jgi:hypothetical protein
MGTATVTPLASILSAPGQLAGQLLGGSVGELAVQGLKAILAFLLGGLEKDVSVALLRWLTTISPQVGGPSVRELYQVSAGMAIGLLGLVMTVTVARLYVGGLSLAGGGGFDALEGLSRSVAAGLSLLLWPWLFTALVGLANHASATVLASSANQQAVVKVLTVTLLLGSLTGNAGAILLLFQVIVGALLFLALLLLKVVVAAATTLLFVAGPLAIVLWPLEELAWISRFVARSLIVVLLIPLVWALIFATFAAVSADALGSGQSPLPSVTGGLVGIAMLWLAVTIPRDLLRVAMLGARGGGGGLLARTVSYVASRQVYAALTGSEVLPFGPRGHRGARDPRGEGAAPGLPVNGERDTGASPDLGSPGPATDPSPVNDHAVVEDPAAWRYSGWDGTVVEAESAPLPGTSAAAAEGAPALTAADDPSATGEQIPTVGRQPRVHDNAGLGETSPPPIDATAAGPAASALAGALELSRARAAAVGATQLPAEAQGAFARMDAPARESSGRVGRRGSEGSRRARGRVGDQPAGHRRPGR